MKCPPTITTGRLVLRPMTLSDAKDVQRLAGDKSVAEMTALVPHPYEDGMAEAWIATHQAAFAAGEQAVFGITDKPSGVLIGCIGLVITKLSMEGELGYWIGKSFWGRGYCTEAAGAVLRYGFRFLALTRIHAHHLKINPASGRVLHKVGMLHEGSSAEPVETRGRLEHVEYYGIKREHWMASQGNSNKHQG